MSKEINRNMCRICMKTIDGISIYLNSGIIKKLQFCTQLEISKTDDLPKIICNNCIGRLEIAYDFRKQAECSDKYLRQVITHQKEENQSKLGKQGLYDEIYRTRIKVEQDDQIEQLTNFESEGVSNVNISLTLEGINCKGTERLIDSVPVYPVVGEFSAADKVKIEEIEEADIEKIQETKQINLFTIAKVTSIPKIEFNQTNEITGNESCSQKDIESLSDDRQIKVEPGDQMKQLTDVKSVTISATIEEDIQHKGSTSGADLAQIEKLQETIFKIARVTSIRKNEDDKTDKFECLECGSHFTRKGSLKRHSLIHSGDRSSGTSLPNESLERHSQIHLGKRSYKSKGGDQTDKFECIECGAHFTRKGSLKRHSIIHSVERPSGTPLQNESLERHSQIHSGERSYKNKGGDQTDKCVCMVCGERFTTNGSLKRHSITHSGVRPYKCNFCSRSFALSFNLASHKRLHTGQKGYTCETCGSHFRSKKTLTQHVFIKHGNQKKTEMEINVVKQTERKKQPTQIGTAVAETIEEGVCFKGTERQVYTCEPEERKKKEEIEEEKIQETKPINDITIAEVTSIHKNDDDEQAERKNQSTQNGTALADTIEEGIHFQRQVYSCESKEEEKKEEVEEEKIQETKPINDITITEVISIRKNDDDQTDKIECVLCGAHFTKIASLKRHSIIHSGARPHKCNLCSRSFAQAYNLASHKRRHRGEKGYTCENCGSLFRSKKTLKQHVFIKHGNQKKAETEINGVKIQETKPTNDITITEVIPVRRSGNPTDKIECSLCGAKFTKRASLKRHLLIHSGERPHKCNSCDQSFALRYNLICHMMTHSAEKPYTCETCGFPFRHQNSLNRHVLMKHGNQTKAEMEINGVKIQETKPITPSIRKNDKPTDKIECTLCGAKFTKRASLKRHSLIHSGERPHKCNLCDLTFAQKYTLSCHMVRHSDGKPYTCKTCGLPFRLQKTLDRHMYMMHENQKKAEVERIIKKQKEHYRRKRQLLLARETPEEAALRREKEAAGTRRQRYRAKQRQMSNE